MTTELPELCPDCGEPVTATDGPTGVRAREPHEALGRMSDIRHFLCLPCGKAWQQRLAGPLVPDVAGERTFLTCRDHTCGATLRLSRNSSAAPSSELTCPEGHRHLVTRRNGELVVELIPG